VKLCTPQCACLLKRLSFAEVGESTSAWHQNTNRCRATVVCLDGKGLWKPRQSFILAGFTHSLPCSASCGTGQTTIDTGWDLALPRSCVDYPTDFNLFKKYNLIKFARTRPLTLTYNAILWNCRWVPDEITCFADFLRCLSALTLICMKVLMFRPINSIYLHFLVMTTIALKLVHFRFLSGSGCQEGTRSNRVPPDQSVSVLIRECWQVKLRWRVWLVTSARVLCQS